MMPGAAHAFSKLVAAGGGGASWARTKSIRFNNGGSTDEFAVGGQPSNIVGINHLTTARTYSCWARINTAGTDATFFAVAEQTNRPIQIYVVSGLITVYLGTNQGQWGTAITSGQWYHICVTCTSSGAATLYVDGTSRATWTAGTTATALDITFGARRNSGNTGSAWTGPCNVAQFAVYTVAFNSTEVNEDRNSGVPINPASHSQAANLIRAWWCGDGDTFPTMTEQVGGGTANCTMTNMESADIESVSP